MRFQIDSNPQTGNCEQCGSSGEIYRVTISKDDRTVSKYLCRGCAVKAKQYVDRKNQSARNVTASKAFEQTNNHTVSAPEKQPAKKTTNKKIVALILAATIVMSSVAVGFVIWSKKSDIGKKEIDYENIGEIYYQETPAEHIAETDVGIKYADNELLVVAKDGVKKPKIEKLAKKYDATVVGFIEATGDYQWELSKTYSNEDLESVINQISNEKEVDSASLNYFSEISIDAVDYDIQYGSEYAKAEVSDSADDIPVRKSWNLEAINAIQAWKFMDEHKSEINPVRVGVIDNGFDVNHNDLSFAETFYNDSFSKDYLAASDDDKDDMGHGTHVAGIMAARGDNDIGICGIYPYSEYNGNKNLYAINWQGSENKDGVDKRNGNLTSGIWEKICFAELILRNVKTINCSFGNNAPYKVMYWLEKENYEEIEKIYSGIENESEIVGDFLNRLLLKGYDFVIVSSAGNEYSRNNKSFDYNGETTSVKTWHVDAVQGSDINFIKKEKFENLFNRIIVVGAINSDLRTASYSNQGDRVDVLAPGGEGSDNEKVYSTIPFDSYGRMAGTSMAAPHVAGLAADIWSINNNLTGEQVKNIILETKKDSKLIDCEAAVKKAFNEEGESTLSEKNNGSIMGYVVDADELEVKDNIITSGAISRAEFIVKDAKTGAEISNENDVFITDKNGHFEFILPPGEYKLTVYAAGYDPYELPDPVKVYNQQVTYLDDWIKLTKAKSEDPLVASDGDFKELNRMFRYMLDKWVKFDTNDSNAEEEATDLLFTTRWPFKSLLYYYDTVTDPQNAEGTKTEIGYSGEKVDEILRNVFGVTPSHSGRKGVWYYSKNKYFEIINGGCGPDPRETEITGKSQNIDGTYTVIARARSWDNDEEGKYYSAYEHYTINVKLYDLNGKKQWRILSIQYNGSDDEPTKENSVSSETKIESGNYQSAYKQVLNEYLNSHSDSQSASFCLVYLDEDNTPELLISEGEQTYSTVYIYSYDGKDAYSMGNFGSYGSFAYVERHGTIVLYYDKHGGNGLESYTAVLKKSGNTYKTSWLAMDNTENFEDLSPGELIDVATYEINGEKVSCDEYTEEYNKNVPTNTQNVPTVSEGGSHKLTQSEINSL